LVAILPLARTGGQRMTLNEWIEKFTDYEPHFDQVKDEPRVYAALLGIVELAKTYTDEENYVNEEFSQGVKTAFRLVMDAIEKELG
jgi:hypothetical protein